LKRFQIAHNLWHTLNFPVNSPNSTRLC